MPYKDGNPTLGEQIEEDERRDFYTRDILKESRADRDEIKRLRAERDEAVRHLRKLRKFVSCPTTDAFLSRQEGKSDD